MKKQGTPSPAVVALLLILTGESTGAIAVTGVLLYELRSSTPDTYSTAVALVATVGLGALWIVGTTIGFFLKKQFSRGSAIAWNVLQAAIGVVSNQGEFGRPDIGSALLIPALVALGLLLFAKPVQDHVAKQRTI